MTHGQGPKFGGRREYQMEVAQSKDPRSPRINPFLLGQCLTLGAVAVPAGIVGRMLLPAVRADFQMTAEGGGPTLT